MKERNSMKVVVDRIEGELAVLVLYDDDRVKFNFPIRFLPEGVTDGDHLQVEFTRNESSRNAQKARIDDLLSELKGR